MTSVQEKPTFPTGQATIEDLYRVDGKAELVNGEVMHLPLAGEDPGFASDSVFHSLHHHNKSRSNGRAGGSNRVFIVGLPGRQSFSPDAAYYVAQRTGMKFVEGVPLFAVEVRSEGDYGPAAEAAMAGKRADYFAAGTLVVWDMDLLNPEAVVRVHRATDPAHPTVYRRGEVAEAEPAVPGWTMSVDNLFIPPV